MGSQSLFSYVVLIPVFLTNVVIPFLFGLAFLFFVWNAIRYFVIEAADDDGREKARSLALYAVAAFVFLIIFWGVVQMLVWSLGLYGAPVPCPDYLVGIPNSPCRGGGIPPPLNWPGGGPI
jgi:hypothetical protein